MKTFSLICVNLILYLWPILHFEFLRAFAVKNIKAAS